jgi:hypothetical protein
MPDLQTIDQFINDLDSQGAAWYVLVNNPNPSPLTIPTALGGPGDTVLPPGSTVVSPTGQVVAGTASPNLILIVGLVVVAILVLRG